MPSPYSDDLRQKVFDALDSGYRKSYVSRLFNISRNTIDLWLKRCLADNTPVHPRHSLNPGNGTETTPAIASINPDEVSPFTESRQRD